MYNIYLDKEWSHSLWGVVVPWDTVYHPDSIQQTRKTADHWYLKTKIKHQQVTAVVTAHLSATWQNQQNGCAPSEDSDQPGHPPSLIRVIPVRMKKPWVLSYPLSAQWRSWSDFVDAQADLSLRWAHNHFVSFVMSLLILWCQPRFLNWYCPLHIF